MKILILNPRIDEFKLPDVHLKVFAENHSGTMFPRILGIAEFYFSKKNSVEIYDENNNEIIEDFKEFDWIIAYVDFNTEIRISKIYKSIIETDTKILGIGKTATLTPFFVSKFLHLCVSCEIEAIFEELEIIMKDFMEPQILEISGRNHEISFPRWGKLPLKHELIPFELGRGCKSKCEFCPTPKIFPGNKINRKIEDISEEIELLKQLDNNSPLILLDDDFLADQDFAIEFFEIIKDFKNGFIGKTCLRNLENFDIDIFPENLKSLAVVARFSDGHEVPGIKEKEILIKLAKKRIKVELIIIVGFRNDCKNILEKWINFVDDLPVLKICIIPIIPIPGTPDFEICGLHFKRDQMRLLQSSVSMTNYTMDEYLEFISEVDEIIRTKSLKSFKTSLV